MGSLLVAHRVGAASTPTTQARPSVQFSLVRQPSPPRLARVTEGRCRRARSRRDRGRVKEAGVEWVGVENSAMGRRVRMVKYIMCGMRRVRGAGSRAMECVVVAIGIQVAIRLVC